MNKSFTLEPGAVPFPGYCLHLPIGRGGCGEVWEAQGPDGLPLALKFMACRNTTAATKEVRSFQALNRLRHPNLLRVNQVYLQYGYIVIAMELADGSLMDLLEASLCEYGSALSPEMVCDYLSQAAQALDFLNSQTHLHEGRTVAFQHCDIKPSNLLFSGEAVKLADFGLATPIDSGLESHGRSGTLDFAAPEIFRGQISDRSDQYSLATSYYLLRTGNLPFRDTPTSFTPTYSRGQPDLSLLSARERPIIAKALSLSPLHRWPSCGELMARLRESSIVRVS